MSDPTHRSDQFAAATRDAETWAQDDAAQPDVIDVAVKAEPPPWLARFIDAHNFALAGDHLTCPHITDSIVVTHCAAWSPGAICCTRCAEAGLLEQLADKDALTCDVCGGPATAGNLHGGRAPGRPVHHPLRDAPHLRLELTPRSARVSSSSRGSSRPGTIAAARRTRRGRAGPLRLLIRTGHPTLDRPLERRATMAERLGRLHDRELCLYTAGCSGCRPPARPCSYCGRALRPRALTSSRLPRHNRPEGGRCIGSGSLPPAAAGGRS